MKYSLFQKDLNLNNSYYVPIISSLFAPFMKFNKDSLENKNKGNIYDKNKTIFDENNNFKFNFNNLFNKDKDGKIENKNRLFTHHNYGYKCCCTKTQCIRKYCQCFNEGRYCVDCDCRNCLNQLPKYSSNNIKNIQTKTAICTCTKSGCNKNYCECFKNGEKCTNLCRCVNCENCDSCDKNRNKNFSLEECTENSVYIISNICVIEDIKEYKKMKKDKLLNKKRKKDNNKINMKN